MRTVDDVQRFFEPSLDHLHSPWLMDGMEVAVDRIVQAISARELIWIHGDYDVDGTSSTAMSLHFLRRIGARVDYHIPSRLEEGFGFTPLSVDRAHQAGATVIVTVDVGVTASKAVERARSLDIDVIVCDHHQAAEDIPGCLALLDPIKPGCSYPFKGLAACGVAFKLIQALSERQGYPELAYEYLDFAAIASAADIAPLVGENRVLSHFGLELLNSYTRAGFKGLIDCAGLPLGQLTNSSVIFGMAPRINAAGRLGDPRRAVEMMLQDDELRAFQIAQELEHDNRQRRAIDEHTFEEAAQMAEQQLINQSGKALILHKDSWHAGVIGIVASRLVERFNVPSIMLTTIDGIAKGSARSVKQFDIHDALKQCEDLLIEFGGHIHAAGLSLAVENIPELQRRLDEIAAVALASEKLEHEIVIDAELQFNDLSPSLMAYLGKFAPFGHQNTRPVFITHNVVSANGVKIVGNNHLKFRAMHRNFQIDAIGFGLGGKLPDVSHGRTFSMVYTLEENFFHGTSSPQIRIKDVRATS
ncbi:MAG: single-stranded-DNA-specific exonuclease RecJ [Candidatus Kapabacteria bacterium]|nr:single-stranded-DNA-specific exonuclease RecJ [Candidatus Kapabacteria bacterium]